jgi:signal peptidase II
MTDNKPDLPQKTASLWHWLGIAVVVALLDQAAKITVLQFLQHSQSIQLTGFFNLVLTYNKGAAFSFLATQGGWQRYLFTAIAVGAVLLLTWLLKKHPAQRLFCWGLALILGGAIGNLIDRVVYGHVVDFLDFHAGGWHWPAFNIADSAICVGAALYILHEFRNPQK